MRIGFSGKGGSGKTTLAYLFARYLLHKKSSVLTLDSDINQHLGAALELDKAVLAKTKKLGVHFKELTSLIQKQDDIEDMEKVCPITGSTPADHTHRFIRFDKDDAILNAFATKKDTLYHLSTGAFEHKNAGKTCYHAYTAGAELFLTHFLDGENETVIADLTAGADPYSSGIFRHFDLMVMVVEPTLKSLEVFKQAQEYSTLYNIPLCVIGNKIADADDALFIQKQTKEAYLGGVSYSSYIKNIDKGIFKPIKALETENLALLHLLHQKLLSIPKNWTRYQNMNIDFHCKASKSWANACHGKDLTESIDRSFSYETVLYPQNT